MKTRRKNKKKKNKTRKQFGGTMGTYVPSKEDNPFVDNIVRNMVSYIFSVSLPGYGQGFTGIMELYLYGYDDFIGEHKLIPLYFHGGGKLQLNLLNVELKLNVLGVGHGGDYDFDDHSEAVTDSDREMEREQDEWVRKMEAIKVVYYYLTPFVYRNCIKQYSLISEAPASDIDVPGYNGKQTILKKVRMGPSSAEDSGMLQANVDDPYGDKFLVFPPKNDYEIFDFIPNETTNVYHVPNIGDVILDKPQGDIIWYNEQVRIIFEKGFIPPEIKTNQDEFPFNTYAAVGEELTNRD